MRADENVQSARECSSNVMEGRAAGVRRDMGETIHCIVYVVAGTMYSIHGGRYIVKYTWWQVQCPSRYHIPLYHVPGTWYMVRDMGETIQHPCSPEQHWRGSNATMTLVSCKTWRVQCTTHIKHGGTRVVQCITHVPPGEGV